MSRVLHNCWLWSGWLLSPATTRHDFNANPVIGSPLLNRLGLHVLRLLLAHAVTWLRWLLLAPLMSPADRLAFHRDGYIVLRNVLNHAQFSVLRSELDAAQGVVRECMQGDTLTQRLLLDDTVLRSLPQVRQILYSAAVARPLRYAAAKNCRPFQYLQLIRNSCRSGAPDPQKNLHSDTFHPTMKAWLFLDDVSERNGPFTYVPGSNRLSWARLKWEYRRSLVAARLQDGYSEKGSFRFAADDLRELGLPPPVALCLPRNTLVIANTFGIHCRGQAEPGARREELWMYSRFNPFNPWPGLGLPFYSRADYALTQWWWGHLDREAEMRGQLSSWHPISQQEFRAD